MNNLIAFAAVLWLGLRIILAAFAGFAVYYTYQQDWLPGGLFTILTVLQIRAID